MQLVEVVSIPRNDGELEITTEKLKKLRDKGFPLEWYVLFAVQLSYSGKNPFVSTSSFCEEWGLLEHELDSAIAKLQKKGLLYRPSKTIQLELFDFDQQEQE